jgi:Ca-activated chloride channel family protein
MRRFLLSGLAAFAALAPASATACTTDLILAIDVSNSIDSAEYRIQTEGLADALLAADIQEELVGGEVALMVVQWSGQGRQQVSIPWRRMRTHLDVTVMAAEARALRRAFLMSDTAVGDVIRFSLNQFGPVNDCLRRVIDVSGDGADNAGTDPRAARRLAERLGVQINGLAIEGMGLAITNFYRAQVITRDGFVMTARGHSTYAETLRRKILREVSRALL